MVAGAEPPRGSELGEIELIVGAPPALVTLEVAVRELSLVSVSPLTVVAAAVSVCVPAVLGVQEKLRVCETPAASVID